jgi:hypothetical protein
MGAPDMLLFALLALADAALLTHLHRRRQRRRSLDRMMQSLRRAIHRETVIVEVPEPRRELVLAS